MKSEKEKELRRAMNGILNKLADLVDNLNNESFAKQYYNAKGDFDYVIFKLAKEISANKKKKV